MVKTIAVIFGGKSAEHDVSIITAHVPIIDTLAAIGEFDVWPIYISKEGRWYCDKKMNDLEFFRDPGYEEKMNGWKTVQLSLDKGLTLIWPGIAGKRRKIDLVFPAMHGTDGEDGALMGVLRMAGVPFVGCDVAASAVAMDKALTKQVLAAEGIPVVPYVWFTKRQWHTKQSSCLAKIEALHWPLFVKPVHLGSSIAIAKVKNASELVNAIEVAFHYDDKALAEQSVEPLIEVTLPIMGNDEPRPALLERPLNHTEMFDFSDKYLSGGKKGGGGAHSPYSEIPADIGADLADKTIELGKKTYTTLGCSGIARVDFLINADTREVYVNEVNTLPGSLYHHNWKQAGVSNRELVHELMKLAEERFAAQKNTTRIFTSGILQKAGGPKRQ